MKILLLICVIIVLSFYNICAQLSTLNGIAVPTTGTIRSLIIFAEVKPIGPIPCNDDQVTNPSWPVINGRTQVPDWAPLLFNPDIPLPNEAKGIFTELYGTASFNQLNLLGDYYDYVFQVDANGCNTRQQLLNEAFNKDMNRPRLTRSGKTLSDFDLWTDHKVFEQRTLGSDSKIDLLIVIWRNYKNAYIDYYGGGFGLWYRNVYGSFIDINTNQSYNAPVSTEVGLRGNSKLTLAFNSMFTELFHGFYGGNNFHTAGGAYSNQPTFLGLPSSYSLSSQGNGAVMFDVNGWDRWRLGWKSEINRPDISAKTEDNSSYANTALTIDNAINNNPCGIYRLRSHRRTGDVIQIKLPSFTGKRQKYLWLENRQMHNDAVHYGYKDHDYVFNTYLANTYGGVDNYNSCEIEGDINNLNRYGMSGVYAYIQVGKDLRSGNNLDVDECCRDIFFPVTAEGNYDYDYAEKLTGADFTQAERDNWLSEDLPCHWWHPDMDNGDYSVQPFDVTSNNTTKENPMTGHSDLYKVYDVYKGIGSVDVIDGADRTNSIRGGIAERGDNGLEFKWDYKGDLEDVFTPASGRNEISLRSNPPAAPVYTLENNKIDLNGLKIKILREEPSLENPSEKDIIVSVCWDKYEVDLNRRWCGNLYLRPNTFNVANPSLIVKNNINTPGTITLDRGLSAQMSSHYQNIITEPFTAPTVLTVTSNAYAQVIQNGKIVVTNGSNFVIEQDAILEIKDDAQIIVKAGSTIQFKDKSKLKISGNGQLIIEEGAKLVYEDKPDFQLNSPNAIIHLDKGDIFLSKKNITPVFTFNGGGHLKITRLWGGDPFQGIGKVRLTGTSSNQILLVIVGNVSTGYSTNWTIKDGVVKITPFDNSYLGQLAITQTLKIDNENQNRFENMTVVPLFSTPYDIFTLGTQNDGNVIVENCKFIDGHYNLSTNSANNGVPNAYTHMISNSLMSHSKKIGMSNFGGNYNISNTRVEVCQDFDSQLENSTAILSAFTSFDSNISNSVSAINNSAGMFYLGTGKVNMSQSRFYDNKYHNLWVIGPAEFNLKCNKFEPINVTESLTYPVHIKVDMDAVINLDYISEINRFLGKNVFEFGENQTGSVFLANKGGTIRTTKGQNCFNFPERQDVFKGLINQYPYVFSDRQMELWFQSDYNYWNGQDGGPFQASDFKVAPSQINALIIRNRNIPTCVEQCVLQEPCPNVVPPTCYNYGDMVFNSGGLVIINTVHFDGIPVNEAFKSIVISDDNNTEKINKLSDIVSISSNDEMTSYLKDLSSDLAVDYLKSGVLNREFGYNSEKIQNVLGMLNSRLEYYGVDSATYDKRVHFNIKKVDVLRLSRAFMEGLNLLDTMQNWTNGIERKFVKTYRCALATEMLISTDITIQEFEGLNVLHCVTEGDGHNSQTRNSGAVKNENKDIISKILVYPNPTNGEITFEISEQMNEITIYDIVGKIVMYQKFDEPVSKYSIDMKSMIDGVYAYTLTFKDKKINGRFIKSSDK